MLLKNIFIYVFCFALFSCNTESLDASSEKQEENSTDLILLKKIIETEKSGEVITTNYNYDRSKLTSFSSSDNYKTQYTYKNDKIIRVDNYQNNISFAYTTLEYDSNSKLTSYTAFYHTATNEELADRHVLTYNSDNSVTDKVYKGDYTSQAIFSHTNTYVFNGTNVIKLYDDNYELLFEHDEKNGVFKNVSAIEVLNIVSIDFGGLESNSNNIIKRTENYNNNSEIQTILYTYNDNDYPISSISKYDGEDSSTFQFFYE